MSNDINLSTFPATKLQALAILYLQNQNLSNLTPSQILEKYNLAYKELLEANRKNNSTQKLHF